MCPYVSYVVQKKTTCRRQIVFYYICYATVLPSFCVLNQPALSAKSSTAFHTLKMLPLQIFSMSDFL